MNHKASMFSFVMHHQKMAEFDAQMGSFFSTEQAKSFRDGSKRHKSSPVGKICVPVILGPIFIVDQGSMFFFVSVGFRGYLLTFGFYHVLLNILLVSAIIVIPQKTLQNTHLSWMQPIKVGEILPQIFDSKNAQNVALEKTCLHHQKSLRSCRFFNGKKLFPPPYIRSSSSSPWPMSGFFFVFFLGCLDEFFEILKGHVVCVFFYAKAAFDCQRIGPHSCGDHQETGGEMISTWGSWLEMDGFYDNVWSQHITEIYLDASQMYVEWYIYIFIFMYLCIYLFIYLLYLFIYVFIIYLFIYLFIYNFFIDMLGRKTTQRKKQLFCQGSFCFPRNTCEQWKTRVLQVGDWKDTNNLLKN